MRGMQISYMPYTGVLILMSHDQPFHEEPENEITLTAFRLLTMDLLVLFHVMNEGTINVLGMCFLVTPANEYTNFD